MLNEEIRKFQKATPFAKFEIELVTGRVLLVQHPEFLLVPPLSRAPYFVFVDEDGVAETLNTNLVVGVRQYRNGKQGRRKAS